MDAWLKVKGILPLYLISTHTFKDANAIILINLAQGWPVLFRVPSITINNKNNKARRLIANSSIKNLLKFTHLKKWRPHIAPGPQTKCIFIALFG